MSKKKKSSSKATAAPKARTRFEVTVTDVDTLKPLKDVVVTVEGGTVSQPKTKTNDKGIWLSKAVEPGDYKIVAKLAHYGPVVTQPAPPAPKVVPTVGPVTVELTVATDVSVAKTPVDIRMMRAETTVTLPVQDETYANVELIGAAVKVEAFAAVTSKANKSVEVVLGVGEHTVRVTKLGYSQSARTPNADVVSGKATGLKSSINVLKSNGTDREPGVVEYVIALVLPLDSPTVEIALPMTSDWGRVSNASGLQVDGQGFFSWYNDVFRASGVSQPANKIKKESGFNQVFDNISSLRATPLTLEEFIALFNVIIHETGGDFEPLVEGVYDTTLQKWRETTPKYYFEAKAGVKASYNQGSNRKAGDLLARLGGSRVFDPAILTPAEPATATSPAKPNDQTAIAEWNGTTFPANLGKVTNANLRECDFIKYIGRGYIQVTWHSNYIAADKFVALLAARYGKTGTNAQIMDQISTDDMMTAISDDATVAFALMQGWLDQAGRWDDYHNTNALEWKKFGRRVNPSTFYSSDYPLHCAALHKAMVDSGPDLVLGPKPTVSQP
jgi:hypothetical protein